LDKLPFAPFVSKCKREWLTSSSNVGFLKECRNFLGSGLGSLPFDLHLVDVAFHHGLWIGISSVVVPKQKAMPSLAMLVSWTIWNEQNAGVSHNKYTSSTILLAAITREAEFF
jgi:hypothetical protein